MPHAEQVEKPSDVAREVCARYEVTLAAVKGPGRTKYLSRARKAVATALAERTGYSAAEIGTFLRRDATTIAYLLGRR